MLTTSSSNIVFASLQQSCGLLSFLLIREYLPLLGKLDPNLLHEDMVITKDEVERAVGVVEPVQQHLGHLSLLLPDQPETSTV